MPESMKCHNVSFKSTIESDSKKRSFHHTGEAKITFKDITDQIGANVTTSIKYGTDKKLIGTLEAYLKFGTQYSLGVNVNSLLKKECEEKIWIGGVADFDDNRTSWFKYDVQKKLAEVGVVNTEKHWFNKSAGRFFVDLSKDGSFKDKASFEYTGEKTLDDFTQLKVRAHIDEALTVEGSISHQINEYLSVKASESLQPLQAFNNKSTESYSFGLSFDFEFKN